MYNSLTERIDRSIFNVLAVDGIAIRYALVAGPASTLPDSFDISKILMPVPSFGPESSLRRFSVYSTHSFYTAAIAAPRLKTRVFLELIAYGRRPTAMLTLGRWPIITHGSKMRSAWRSLIFQSEPNVPLVPATTSEFTSSREVNAKVSHFLAVNEMGKVKKDDSKRKSKIKRERTEVVLENGNANGDTSDTPQTEMQISTKEDVKRRKKEKLKTEKASSDKAVKAAKDMDTLQLNSKFAKQYEVRKRREILSSLAPDALEELDQESQGSGDSADEEEDEYGELLTKKLDNQIRKTILALQSKDPIIYKKGTTFFKGSRNDVDASDPEESDAENDSAASSEDEPVAGWDTIAKAAEAAAPKMTIKDYVRETLLQEGELPDSDDEYRRRRRHVDEENEDVARAKTILKEGSDSESESSSDDDDDDDDDDDGDDSDNGGDDENGNDDGGDADDDDDDDDDDDEFFKKKEKTEEELEQEEKGFGQIQPSGLAYEEQR